MRSPRPLFGNGSCYEDPVANGLAPGTAQHFGDETRAVSRSSAARFTFGLTLASYPIVSSREFGETGKLYRWVLLHARYILDKRRRPVVY